LTPGITDVRVRGSAAMTGAAVVTITASGPAVLQQITQTGGGGVSPVLGVNVKLPPYSAVGDGKIFVDGVTNAGNNQLTSATAVFSASDVGHLVWCTNTPLSNTATLWPPGQTTVATFVNSSAITYSGTNAGVKTGMFCATAAPGDPAIILAAYNACKTTFHASQSNNSYQSPGCNIYIPAGIYATSATLEGLISSGNEQCVGIIGDGQGKTILMPTPTFTYTNHPGWFINNRCVNGYLQNFTVDMVSVPNNLGGVPSSAIDFSSTSGYMDNVVVLDQCNQNGATLYGISVTSGSNIVLNRPQVTTNGPCAGSTGGLLFQGGNGDVYSPFLSNTQANLFIVNQASGSNGSGLRIWGGTVDEGSIATIQNSVDVWLNGVTLTGGANCLSVDATSSVWMNGGYCGTFGGNTGSGPTVASGGKLRMTEVSVNGVNAGSYCYNSVAAGGIFDLGGNNCTVSGGATIYKAGSFALTFPLTTQAVTQLGGQQVVSGLVPTSCTVTGNGTSTCAFDTGSTDASGRITITAAGTTTAVGLVSFNFSTTYGTNSTNCSANYLSGTGTWAIGAVAPIFITNTTAATSFNINNAGTNLTATSTYKVNYTCYGQ